MQWKLFCFSLVLCLKLCQINCEKDISSVSTGVKNVEEKVLSRKKRYLTFPEGSSFSAACCMTVGVIGNPNFQFLSWALNYGIAYELPTNASTFLYRGYENEMDETPPPEVPKPVMQRRFRRDLYNKLELAMDDMGYHGKECILRALCESSQFFQRKGSNMIEELIRVAFTLPKSKVQLFEHRDLHEYNAAHRRGLTNSYCPQLFPNCGFSILELLLGRYSSPIMNFM